MIRFAKLSYLIAVLFIGFASNLWANDYGCRPRRYLNEQLTSPHVVLSGRRPSSSDFLPNDGLESLGSAFQYFSGRKSQWQGLSEYIEQNCVTGLLVLKNGKLLLERYAMGRRPQDALTSASMSKSLTALATGLLIDKGRLRLNDKVGTLLPDFAQSAFAEDTVEDLLRMTSAAKLVDGYSDMPDKEGDNTALHPLASPQTDSRKYLSNKKEKDAKPGERFFYSAANTAMLAIIAQEVAQEPINTLFEQGIWRYIASGNGYWQRNRRGDVGVQCCFLATLRDWGRIGELISQRGRFGDTQLLSESFMRTFGAADPRFGQPRDGRRYGFQVWVPRFLPEQTRDAVELRGAFGQIIFADPTNNIVIVHTASAQSENTPFRDWESLRNAIVKTISTTQ